jgi:Arc/MetJ family transcription regulator
MHMRTTLELSDELVAEARAASGLERISDLVREGLRELIAREARRELASMGGGDRLAKAATRRRAVPLRSTTERKKEPAS